MSQFSELLKGYAKSSGGSNRKLAAKIGMDRTLLQKYLSGERLPKNREEVEVLSKGLMLSVYQQGQLIELYYREVYGNKKYDCYLQIKTFYENIENYIVNDVFGESMQMREEMIDLPEELMVRGTIQIQNVLVQYVKALSARESEGIKIRLLVHPEQKELLRVLLIVCSCLKVEIEHIICFDANRSDNANFSALFSVLPFEINDITYQARYYYDFPEAQGKQMNLLENMILIGDYAFICNREMDECLILGRRESVDFFKRQYEKIRKMTDVLEYSARYITNMTEYSSATLGQNTAIEFGAFPCIMMGLDARILQKYLIADKLQKEEVSAVLDNMIRQMKNQTRLTNYFSEHELRKFMETGEISIYPDCIYRRPELADRLVILGRLIDLAKKGVYTPYICNEAYFQMRNIMIMEYDENERLCVRWKEKDKLEKAIVVMEPSVGDTLVEFAGFAMENGWFYDEKESLERMEAILKEFQEGKYI